MNRLALAFAAVLLAPAVLCGAQETPSAAEQRVYDDLDLDDATVSRLMATGLVVLPGETLLSREHGELTVGLRSVPLYVTPDVMLSLWHAASREAVGAIEVHWLLPRLNDLCQGLLAATARLRAEADEPALERNAFVLEVACSLLDDAHVPSADLSDRVRAEVARVREHVGTDEAGGVDYTLYAPPARHVDRPALCSYFAAARYLELHRVGLEADRQDAALLALALRSETGPAGLYREVLTMRAYLYGPAEQANLDELSAAMGPAWTRANPGHAAAAHAALGGRDVAILPASGAPEAAMLRSGGQSTGLQVAAALGSELAAVALREKGLEAPAANAALPSMGLPAAGLNLLRTLLSDPGRTAPASADLHAQQQLNCCLSAWVVGRSDVDLACPDCDGPSHGAPVGGLVEPIPAFFSAYAGLCRDLLAKLDQLQAAPKVAQRLARLARKAEVFSRCAQDQLAGRDTSWAANEIGQFHEWVRTAGYAGVPVLTRTAGADGQADHVGTGRMHRALVRYRRDGERQLAMGWIGSYCEVAAGPRSLLPAQWEARLAADYAAPRAPAYLSVLYPPRDVSPQAEQLRRIEELLLSGDLDAGMQAFEAFVTTEQNGPWAPQAALTVASAWTARAGVPRPPRSSSVPGRCTAATLAPRPWSAPSGPLGRPGGRRTGPRRKRGCGVPWPLQTRGPACRRTRNSSGRASAQWCFSSASWHDRNLPWRAASWLWS